MANNQVIMVADKQSFLVRVLMQKVQAAEAECVYVPFKVNDISSKLQELSLVILYMEEDDGPHDDVLHYLIDALSEKSGQIILIGEQRDLQTIENKIPKELLFHTFTRPVDNAEFTKRITDYFERVESEEYKKSILVVDDDPQYLALVREWLKSTYKVSMANSGLQAIKWLAKNKVDLILLDHEMPITTGPQVLEMLRNDPETQSIPVMFLTGKSDKESVMAVVALRPEGYFLKTIQKEELLEKLQEFFILHKS